MTKNTAASAGTILDILDIDPTTLGIDDQVRADATPDEELIASVKRTGVLQPPTVYWDDDRQQHIIVIGHRRVGAAIAAKLPTIQVLVRDEADAKDALRLELQLVENERRAALTPADVARGYKNLNLFGLRPEDIAAAVADKPARVKAAIAAMDSEGARASLAHGIDLEQAALIAEFEDAPTLQAALTETALTKPQNFAVKVEETRDKRAAMLKKAELVAQLDAEDVELVETVQWNDSWWSGGAGGIARGDGRTLTRLGIDPAEHASCPGHAAIIHNSSSAKYIEILYVCTAWQEHHNQPADDELTPEQIERQQEFERARAEREAREAAFAANTTARREWLRGFITGRLNQTQGLFDLIAETSIGTLALDECGPHEEHSTAIYLLTGEHRNIAFDEHGPLAEMISSGRVTALRALTADALATAEYWASTPGTANLAPRTVAAYFEHLTTWGYQLTDLDQEIVAATAAALAEADERDAEEVTE